jgi:hypothetical protein
MLDASPIDIWLAGHHLAGVARIVNEANDHETVAAALTRYRVAFPRVTHTSVVVRVDVSPTPGPGEATQEPWDLGTTDVDTGAGSS